MSPTNNNPNETLLRAKEAYFACDFKNAFPLFEKAAKAGNAEAQCRLGEFYDDFGHGFPVDYKKARELYEQSWAQGFPRAAARLSMIYSGVLGVKRDKEKAKVLLEESVELGDSFGKFLKVLSAKGDSDSAKNLTDELVWDSEFIQEVGLVWKYILDFGQEIKKLASRAKDEDISEEAEKIREKFIEKAEKELSGKDFPSKYTSECMMAIILEDTDDELAEKHYRRAAQSGGYDVLSSYAYFLQRNGKPGAAELARKAVENIRNAKAMLTLGKCYLLGEDVDQDEEKAEDLLKEMLETVDPEDDKDLVAEAYFYLGILEHTSRDDSKKALEYYKKAEEQEGVFATLAVGRIAEIYYLAENPEAFEWAEKGAEQDESNSLRILSRCYRDGVGTEKDLPKHIEVAMQLRDMEDPGGVELLAFAYHNGIGVPEDDETALEYYKKAEEYGSDCAKEIAEIHWFGLKAPESWANADEAFKWAKLGVERGNDPDAYAMLYLCHNNGVGTAENESEAQKMLKEGAEKGSELCKEWLEEN